MLRDGGVPDLEDALSPSLHRAAVSSSSYNQHEATRGGHTSMVALLQTPVIQARRSAPRSSGQRSGQTRTSRQRQTASVAHTRLRGTGQVPTDAPSALRTTQAADRASDLRLFPMRQQRRKEVWQFVQLAAKQEHWHLVDIDLKNEHAAFAYCPKCKCKIAYQPTSNKVLAHMERHHADDMRTFLLAKAQPKDGASRDLLRAFVNADEPQKKRVARRLTANEQKRVNKLLAQWIARHFRPMMMVEDAGFVEFVRYIAAELGNVHIDLSKRTQLRKEVVTLARELQDQVRELVIKGCHYYSITSDIWTARNARSYLSCTLHYVNEDFYPVNWTLKVRELAGIHDSSAIASSLRSILQEWSLPIDRYAKLVRDGGSNMVRAARDMGVNDMSCIAHAIHLVVSGLLVKPRTPDRATRNNGPDDGASLFGEEVAADVYEDELLEGEQDTLHNLQELAIQELESYLDETLTSIELSELDAVRKVVQGFRSIAVYFRKSPKARNRLAKIQQDEMNTPAHAVLNLIVDCPTRWNSCFDMLERFITLKPAIRFFFGYLGTAAGQHEFKDVKRTLFKPRDADWLTITCLRTLLVSFFKATVALSGQSYPTLLMILPTLSSIRRRLFNRNLFDHSFAIAGDEVYVDETRLLMNACRVRIFELFEKRFASLQGSDLEWIAFLDPRVSRKIFHITETTRPIACAAIIRASIDIAQHFDRLAVEESPVPAARRSPDLLADDDGDVGDDVFGGNFDESSTAYLEEACSSEFAHYTTEKHKVKPGDDPFEWWRVNRHKYPNLSRLARKWLGVVATSVPPERAFSTSGNIVTVKRSSLAPDMVRDLVFVSENGRI